MKLPTSSETQEMDSRTVKCQLAAFGAYLPEERSDLKVVLPPGDDMMACSALDEGQERSRFEGAAVVVRRGDARSRKNWRM